MDKAKAQMIREKAEAHLATLGDELGLQITIKNGKFDDGQITYQIEFAELGENGIAETKEAGDFKAYAWRWDLQPEDLGRTFEHNGKTFTIIGAKPRATKMPILANDQAGQGYKFPAETVKRLLGAAA